MMSLTASLILVRTGIDLVLCGRYLADGAYPLSLLFFGLFVADVATLAIDRVF